MPCYKLNLREREKNKIELNETLFFFSLFFPTESLSFSLVSLSLFGSLFLIQEVKKKINFFFLQRNDELN
jgi:hypothetical protein